MILNHTRFAADVTAGWDHHLRPYQVVIVSAVFEIRPDTNAIPVDAGDSLRGADVYFGEPGRSSVRYEADIAPEKPNVDVIVNARAYAPGGRKADRVPVTLQVGSLVKQLIVVGDRDSRSSRPRPFAAMPIVYERAVGGAAGPDGAEWYASNPVGLGYKGSRPTHPSIETVLPNVEYADRRIAPAGFGVISRAWRPRLDLAGTYDERWLKERWPMLPADFQPAHHQAVPPDQQLPELNGGELVELTNMTPEGTWRFRVPTLRVPLHLWYADRGETARLRVDTLQLEPDLYRVTVKARVRIPIVRGRPPLRQVILGHITHGWWRARQQQKVYVDWRGQQGRQVTAGDFEA